MDEDILNDHLREVEDFILSRTSFGDRRAYEACPEATLNEVYAQLEIEGIEPAKGTGGQHRTQQRYEASWIFLMLLKWFSSSSSYPMWKWQQFESFGAH